VYVVQIQLSECQELLTNGQSPLYFLADEIPLFINIKLYHPANNFAKSADALYNSMIDDRDGHIPSPMIMFTCTTLRDSLLVWQKN